MNITSQAVHHLKVTRMFHIPLGVLSLVFSTTLVLSRHTYARNCQELIDQGVLSTGVYTIKPDASPKPFFVYCDMDIRGGGWLYVINRIDGSKNFSRPWGDYKAGFGNPAHEFWLGLNHLHELTYPEANELLVELVDWDLNKYHAHYKAFSIESEEKDYRLQLLGGYSGDGDSLAYHAGVKFSTSDRDNDEAYGASCSNILGDGGWWYGDCHTSKLTGRYLPKEEAILGSDIGINWRGIPGISDNWYSFKEARMMIRPQTDRALTYY